MLRKVNSKLIKTKKTKKGQEAGGPKTNMLKATVSRSQRNMIRIIKKRFKPREDKPSTSFEKSGTIPAVQPPLYPQLRDSWLAVKSDSLAKDIHRLIYRITVKTSGINNILSKPVPQGERHGIYNQAKAVCDLIILLSKRMLPKEEADEIVKLCTENLTTVSEKTDLLTFNRELFNEMGEDHKVVKVLKCIHQSMVLKPYGILRTMIIKNKLTKDVRGDEGWQIEITVAHEGFIQVIHKRKEQSFDVATKNQRDAKQNHWEYKWEVSMTFDKEMKDMTQSRLSVTDLVLNVGMDPLLEKELKEMMQDGNLIVF